MRRLLLFLLIVELAESGGWVSNLTEQMFDGFKKVNNGTRGFMDTLSTGLNYFNKNVLANPWFGDLCDTYTCEGGTLVANTSTELFANGCGSYGATLPSLLAPGMDLCCRYHDICYAKCGIRRSQCDDNFFHCLRDVCGTVHQNLGEGELFSTCKSLIALMRSAVGSLGCITFLQSQRDYCICQ